MSKTKQVLSRTDASDLQTAVQEVVRLRKVIIGVIDWLERLATQMDKQAETSARFETLADSCRADAKNYRATADNLRKNLTL